MDVIQAIRNYIERIINDPMIDGMKALVLDQETAKIISMVTSQSHILEKEIFLVEQLDASHERMLHLKAIVLVRPQLSNIELLIKEIKSPKYGEYHLFFTNIVSNEILERLAESDEFEIIRQVQEYYADFLAINDNLFHFNLRSSIEVTLHDKWQNTGVQNPRMSNLYQRSIEGVLSVLLSLKKKPIIRYHKRSFICEKMAKELFLRMNHEQDGLFDFRRTDVPPILLLLDRRDDPITPLLSQWTYQAMIHELLGLFENRVDLRQAPNVKKENHEIVLSVTSDTFFEKQMYANFGELGMAVKELVDEYQAKAQTHEHIESIEDMQRFVENYPAFRSKSISVSKHVTLMGELARLVEVDRLMDVSQLEQELACAEDHSIHAREVIQRLKQPEIKPMNKLRLVLLYALRYETYSSNQIRAMKDLLLQYGQCTQDMVNSIDQILQYSGTNVRSSDLYGDRGLKKYMKAMTQGLQGVPNVYAQHNPHFLRVIDTLLKGQLSDNEYGYGNPAISSNSLNGANKYKVKDLIVFIMGGVTFEETAKIAELNVKLAPTGQRIIIGGSFIHNSKTFIDDLQQAYQIPDSHANLFGNSANTGNSDPWRYDGKLL